MPSSSPASQAGSALPWASSRLRCAIAVSWAAISRAWPGSSAQTRRSRKRRRPAGPSWNRRSICGVSQMAANRAAMSAWDRGGSPSSRNTRRSSGPSGRHAGADIGLPQGAGESSSHGPMPGAAAACEIGQPRAPQAAAGRQHRYGFEQVGLAAAVWAGDDGQPRSRAPGQAGVVAEIRQGEANELHAPPYARFRPPGGRAPGVKAPEPRPG